MPVPSAFLELPPDVAKKLFKKVPIITLYEISILSRRAARLVRDSKPQIESYEISVRSRRNQNTTILLIIERSDIYELDYNSATFVFQRDELLEPDADDETTVDDVRDRSFVEEMCEMHVTGCLSDLNTYLTLVHRHFVYIFTLDHPDNKAFSKMVMTRKEMLLLTPFLSDNVTFLTDLELRGGRRDDVVRAPRRRRPLRPELGQDEEMDEEEEEEEDPDDADDDPDMNELDVLYGTSFKNIVIVHSQMTSENINRFLVDWYAENEEMHQLESLTVHCPVPVEMNVLLNNLNVEPWDSDRRNGIYREVDEAYFRMRDYRNGLDLEREDERLLTITTESETVVHIFRWKEPFSDYSDEIIKEIRIVREDRLEEGTARLDVLEDRRLDLIVEVRDARDLEKELQAEVAALEEERKKCEDTVKGLKEFLLKA